MKKVGILILLTLCIMFVFSGCGIGKPDVVVTQFSEALIMYDIDAMSACLSDDNEMFNPSDTDDEFITALLDYLKSEMLNTTYEIKNVETGDKTGTVTVEYKVSDVTPIIKDAYRDFIREALGAAFLGIDEDEYMDIFLECFQNSVETKKPKELTVEIKYKCIVQDKEWKIDDISEEDDFKNLMTCNLIAAIDAIDGSDETSSENELEDLSDLEKKFIENAEEEAVEDNTSKENDVITETKGGNNGSEVITTLGYAEGINIGSWETEIDIEVYHDSGYTLYSGDAIGYMNVSGYDQGYIYNAEDSSGYDLGKGWYICQGSIENMLINITDNGDGGYYVAIYHDDDNMSLIDDYVSYPFS